MAGGAQALFNFVRGCIGSSFIVTDNEAGEGGGTGTSTITVNGVVVKDDVLCGPIQCENGTLNVGGVAVNSNIEIYESFLPASSYTLDASTAVGPIPGSEYSITVPVSDCPQKVSVEAFYSYIQTAPGGTDYTASRRIVTTQRVSCDGGSTWIQMFTNGTDTIRPTERPFGESEVEYEDRECCVLPPGSNTVLIDHFVVSNNLADTATFLSQRSSGYIKKITHNCC